MDRLLRLRPARVEVAVRGVERVGGRAGLRLGRRDLFRVALQLRLVGRDRGLQLRRGAGVGRHLVGRLLDRVRVVEQRLRELCEPVLDRRDLGPVGGDTSLRALVAGLLGLLVGCELGLRLCQAGVEVGLLLLVREPRRLCRRERGLRAIQRRDRAVVGRLVGGERCLVLRHLGLRLGDVLVGCELGGERLPRRELNGREIVVRPGTSVAQRLARAVDRCLVAQRGRPVLVARRPRQRGLQSRELRPGRRKRRLRRP